jgi:hypothetical protein
MAGGGWVSLAAAGAVFALVDGIAAEIGFSLAEEVVSGSVGTGGGFMPQARSLELGREKLE